MTKKGDFKDRMGETHITFEGYSIKIIESQGSRNCTIQFEDGIVLTEMQYGHIKRGAIRNPFHKAVYNVGYIGQGRYDSSYRKCYKSWQRVMERAYSIKWKEKYSSYKDVRVCEEWNCFQNFAKWYVENYIEDFELDKDILLKGNKIYSPETCTFVPPELNKCFTKREAKRGKYPIGVSFHKKIKKFTTSLNRNGVVIPLGYFDTPEEAFQTYKIAKEKWIKELAKRWQGKITEMCYQALINYKVEIND